MAPTPRQVLKDLAAVATGSTLALNASAQDAPAQEPTQSRCPGCGKPMSKGTRLRKLSAAPSTEDDLCPSCLLKNVDHDAWDDILFNLTIGDD
jgi:anaerobic selenocysteine-containing dehydrogenase